MEVLRMRLIRIIMLSLWGCFALLALPGVFGGGQGGVVGQAFAGVIGVSSAGLAIRGWRAATLVVTKEGVTHRSLLRTWSWPWHRIDRFEVRDTRIGVVFHARRVLWLIGSGGEEHKLEEFNERPRSTRREVDRIRRRVNELHQR